MDKLKIVNALKLALEAENDALRGLVEKVVSGIENDRISRTHAQNNSLWLFYRLLAERLNDLGLDQRKLLKPSINIPWTEQAVHDYLWVPIQEAMTGKTSTTQLKKLGEIDQIHEVLCRELGEKHGVEYIPWPSDGDDKAPLKSKTYDC